jgi:hypothetical protein
MPGEMSGSLSMDDTWRIVWFSVDGKYLAKCLVLFRWIIPGEMPGSQSMDITWRSVWFSGEVFQLDVSDIFDGGICTIHLVIRRGRVWTSESLLVFSIT